MWWTAYLSSKYQLTSCLCLSNKNIKLVSLDAFVRHLVEEATPASKIPLQHLDIPAASLAMRQAIRNYKEGFKRPWTRYDRPYLPCSVEVLQDWRVMVDSLTEDRTNEARGDAATTNFILLLAASVHRAVTATQPGSHPNGRQAYMSDSCM